MQLTPRSFPSLGVAHLARSSGFPQAQRLPHCFIPLDDPWAVSLRTAKFRTAFPPRAASDRCRKLKRRFELVAPIQTTLVVVLVSGRPLRALRCACTRVDFFENSSPSLGRDSLALEPASLTTGGNGDPAASRAQCRAQLALAPPQLRKPSSTPRAPRSGCHAGGYRSLRNSLRRLA